MSDRRLVTYTWRGDDQYYSTVVDHYYRQAPMPLHLGAQALCLWIVTCAGVLFMDLALPTRYMWLGALTVLCLAFPYIVKRGIVLKYQLRPTFGAETTFSMTPAELKITGPGAGTFPWSVYDRAVIFSDGMMLMRRAAIRWLPNEALKNGTREDAIALVQSHLPLRVLT